MTSMQQLITLTRMRSNMEQNQFVTDSEIMLYLNQSLGELDDILADTYEDYHISSYQTVLPNPQNTNFLPIASDLLKLRGVDFLYQSSSSPGQTQLWYSVPRFNFQERNTQNSLSAIGVPFGQFNISYNLIDQGIEIIPPTQCQGTYQIWYTPKFEYLLSVNSILPPYMNSQGWSEYAVVDATIKIFNKQNIDPSGFMAEKEGLRQRIISASQNRDSGGVKSVADVRYQNTEFCISPLYGYGI